MMSNRIHPALAAGIVGAFVLIVGVALFFHLRGGDVDRGLMQRHHVHGVCDVSWNPAALPITIEAPPEATQAWLMALNVAIEEWNARLGLEVFRFAGVARGGRMRVGDVMVIWHANNDRAPTDEVWRYQAHPDGHCYMIDGVWHWPALLPEGFRRWFLMHGLGHFMGLEHDDALTALMNPAPRFMTGPYEISDADIAWRRRVYGGRPGQSRSSTPGTSCGCAS